MHASSKDPGWKLPQLLKEMRAAKDFYAQELMQVTGKHWSRGRVVLLGDACYAPSPFTGMGTSLALVGAYVLAGEVSRHPGDLLGALAAYDSVLRPFVEDTQRFAPGLPRLAFAETAWGVGVMHAILWVVSMSMQLMQVLRIDRGLRALEGKLPWQQKTWTLPEYPEMEDVKPKSS